MTNGRFNEARPNEGCVYQIVQILFLLFFALPVGLVMEWVESSRREEVKKHIVNEKIDVIVLHERNDELEKEKLDACNGLWDDSKPVLRLAEGDGMREWFQVDRNRYRGKSPAPAFIERITGAADHTIWSVIYAASAGTESMEQTRAWLKANNYSESDFTLKWTGDGTSMSTAAVSPQCEGSSIGFSGFFETSWGCMWVWEGSDVTNVTSGGPSVREYYGEIQDLVLPFTSNWVRATGIAFIISLFWKALYGVIVVLGYVVIVASLAITLFTGREFAGVRPSPIVLMARMFGTILIATFLISLFWNTLSGRTMFPLAVVKWVSVALTLIFAVNGWIVVNVGSNLLLGNNQEYLQWRAQGGRPYWDSLGWPINPNKWPLN